MWNNINCFEYVNVHMETVLIAFQKNWISPKKIKLQWYDVKKKKKKVPPAILH